MRGSRHTRPRSGYWPGIIPAHAGLTDCRVIHVTHLRDHPRACGAHAVPRPSCSGQSGSSPRMRGSPLRSMAGCCDVGIIPAHAGLTHRPNYGSRLHRDHPRACGAHRLTPMPLLPLVGSSPRMRGSLAQAPAVDLVVGIIPAHAGLTARRRCSGRAAWDHPRACGAHPTSMTTRLLALGSSPRMRGSLTFVFVIVLSFGIIPAHAGLTSRHLS